MQGVPGGRPPPISLSAGGGVERQGSNDPPQFMRALADMHCGTSPQQKMMQEQKRQEWLQRTRRLAHTGGKGDRRQARKACGAGGEERLQELCQLRKRW